jgi:hypothetical protein
VEDRYSRREQSEIVMRRSRTLWGGYWGYVGKHRMKARVVLILATATVAQPTYAMHCRRRDPGNKTPRSLISSAEDSINRTVDTAMFTKTKIALSVALFLSAAFAAMAGGSNRDDNDFGGYVIACSLDGVNPVYHPRIFGNPAVAREYGFVKSRDGNWQVERNCVRGEHGVMH